MDKRIWIYNYYSKKVTAQGNTSEYIDCNIRIEERTMTTKYNNCET